MPLTNLGGIAEGISAGLRNAAAFQGIKSNMAAEERAAVADTRTAELFNQQKEKFGQEKTKFGQEQAEYKRLHDPSVSVADIINKIPDLGAEGVDYAHEFVKAQGLDPAGKISITQARELRDALAKDTEAQQRIVSFRKKNLMEKGKPLAKEIDDLKAMLTNNDQTEEYGGPTGLNRVGIGQTLAEKTAQLEALSNRLEEVNLADPVYKAKVEAANKKRELDIKENAANKIERPVLPNSGAALAAMAIQEKDPAKKAEYLAAAKTAYAEEVRQKVASNKPAATDEEKGQKKMTPATIESFYDKLKKDLTNAEGETIPGYESYIRNIPAYRAQDLDAVSRGQQPRNIGNISKALAGNGQTAAAKPADKAASPYKPEQIKADMERRGFVQRGDGKWEKPAAKPAAQKPAEASKPQMELDEAPTREADTGLNSLRRWGSQVRKNFNSSSPSIVDSPETPLSNYAEMRSKGYVKDASGRWIKWGNKKAE